MCVRTGRAFSLFSFPPTLWVACAVTAGATLPRVLSFARGCRLSAIELDGLRVSIYCSRETRLQYPDSESTPAPFMLRGKC